MATSPYIPAPKPKPPNLGSPASVSAIDAWLPPSSTRAHLLNQDLEWLRPERSSRAVISISLLKRKTISTMSTNRMLAKSKHIEVYMCSKLVKDRLTCSDRLRASEVGGSMEYVSKNSMFKARKSRGKHECTVGNLQEFHKLGGVLHKRLMEGLMFENRMNFRSASSLWDGQLN
ncbi:hypothetical protein KC19_5G066900, partial [Ceratodon purpureus]